MESGRIRDWAVLPVNNFEQSVMSNDHSDSTSISGSVIDYPARDMTITVTAALTIGQLRDVLRHENQQLPVDTPNDELTLEEMVAFDICGPRQYGYGTLRDYLIGIEASDASGRVFHAGGRVVKNVAGYDLCRLLIGAEGQLGTLHRLTLKLTPLPTEQHLTVAAFRTLKDLETSLEKINLSATTLRILDVVNSVAAEKLLPVIDACFTAQESGFADAYLVLGFDGNRKVCDWQTKTIAEELQGLAIGVTSISRPAVMTEYCRAAMPFSRVGNNTARGCSARVTTLPSRVVAVLEIGKDLGLSASGQAGNGIVHLWSEEQTESIDLRNRLTRLIAAGCGSFEYKDKNSTIRHPEACSPVDRYSKLLNKLLG